VCCSIFDPTATARSGIPMGLKSKAPLTYTKGQYDVVYEYWRAQVKARQYNPKP
jgi:hypothetical protein